VQLLLEEFGKYAAGRQAYFTNIYNQVSITSTAPSRRQAHCGKMHFSTHGLHTDADTTAEAVT
jgi:hypothetical protein